MNEFVKAVKGIDQAIKLGTSRALNRALSSTKTQLVRDLSDDTGMKNASIKARVREVKATVKSLNVIIALAVKIGVSLAEFSPSIRKIKVVHQGNTKATTHYGVSVRIGGTTRDIVPGAWLAYGKSGKKLVLARKGKDKYPTQALRTDVFKDAAKTRQVQATKQLADKFSNEVASQIDFAIQQKFNSDKG